MGWLTIQLCYALGMSVLVIQGKLLCDKKCYFGAPCWPSDQTVAGFVSSLKGEVVFPSDARYAKLNTMKNARVKKEPAMIAFVKTIDDVKNCVTFANRFNLPLTILSSGHSFIGRSAHDGSLLINLSNMTYMSVRTDLTNRSPGGEITVETGNNWARVYEEVNKYGRLVVGGSAHTVAMGGYTQGGGHSPLSRSLGLAVDSLLEAKVVTADGHLVTTNAVSTYNHDTEMTSSPDLFWALRGGGGGTWGVVMSFTFKLHMPPSGFVTYLGFYAMVVNGSTPGIVGLTSVIENVKQLPREWAGYILPNTTPQPNQPGVIGMISVSLLHFGDWSAVSRAAIQPLLDDPLCAFNVMNNFSTFWEYERNIPSPDVSAVRSYTLSSMVQPDVPSASFAAMIVEEMFAGLTITSGSQCTFTITGGQMMDVNPMDTPINSGFRSSLFSLTCGRGWTSPENDKYHIGHADRFSSKILKFGKGAYFNEPAENQPDWKTEYWGKGGNYEKLLGIKKRWDPDNVFCCHNCVGSDIDDNAGWGIYPFSSAANLATPLSWLLLIVFVWLM